MPDIPVWYYPIGLLMLTVSIIAVRLTAKFDVNKWLQSKDERRAKQVERLCTHTDMEWFHDELAAHDHRVDMWRMRVPHRGPRFPAKSYATLGTVPA